MNVAQSPLGRWQASFDFAQAPRYELSTEDQERMARAAHRLARDTRLIDTPLDRCSQWSPEVIRGIALEGDLGYEAGRILFGYSHGIKARWKDAQGNCVIRWLVGSAAGECWRMSLLVRSHDKIYVAEVKPAPSPSFLWA